MEGSTLSVIIFAMVGVGALIFISRSMSKKEDKDEQPQQQQEAELAERFHMGKYLGGLPRFNGTAPLVYCGVTEKSFVFRMGTKGSEIDRIPRGFVGGVEISKKDKHHCVTIGWTETNGTKYNATFEFTDNDSQKVAAQAAENIKKWAQQTVSARETAA
ncbi:MAG: hypothetical protein WCQ99_06445 [Pseudomonadota bacterium]